MLLVWVSSVEAIEKKPSMCCCFGRRPKTDCWPIRIRFSFCFHVLLGASCHEIWRSTFCGKLSCCQHRVILSVRWREWYGVQSIMGVVGGAIWSSWMGRWIGIITSRFWWMICYHWQMGSSGGNFVFVQDNALSHVTRNMVAFLDPNDVEVMDWPAQLWAIDECMPRCMRAVLIARGGHTRYQLEHCIEYYMTYPCPIEFGHLVSNCAIAMWIMTKFY